MKTILVTGSTDGIGKQTALNFARAGHTVWIHGRNEKRCQQTVEELKKDSKNDKIQYVLADLSSFEQIRSMADVIKKATDHLDVLVNNAGVYMQEKMLSADGFEMTFAVNHLAYVLLTHELLGHVRKSESGRIVNVSSVAHNRGIMNFNNLNAEQFFDGYQAYALSKLANVMFTYDLSDRLFGVKVTANCLHPGVITTKLLKQGFGISGDDLEKGAATSTYLAVSPDVEKVTGKYFVDKKITSSAPSTYDVDLRKKLWAESERLLGIKF